MTTPEEVSDPSTAGHTSSPPTTQTFINGTINTTTGKKCEIIIYQVKEMKR